MRKARSMFTCRLAGVAQAVALSSLAAGCAPEQAPEPAATVFDDTVETLERARAVEDVTMRRKGDLDERLQEDEE